MPKFKMGQKVRILDLEKPGHVRTPFYIRHKKGKVLQFCGAFLNPEDLAVGKTAGPVVECYRVQFRQRDIWPDYKGPEKDTLVIEIYEHWMKPLRTRARRVPS